LHLERESYEVKAGKSTPEAGNGVDHRFDSMWLGYDGGAQAGLAPIHQKTVDFFSGEDRAPPGAFPT